MPHAGARRGLRVYRAATGATMKARVGIACVLAAAFGSWSCGGTGQARAPVNERAGLTGTLPWNPLGWGVITSVTDHKGGTMSTLYGNAVAVKCARSGVQDCPGGAVVALVTWTMQDDARWFGGRIPGTAKSVEFVRTISELGSHSTHTYERYEGSPLTKTAASYDDARIAYLRSLRAAVMP
jgi:hypothetical protein